MRVKTDSRRHAIVAAAASAFLEHGFDRTTMSDIADRVGYSKATLYGYFPSKDDLFIATMHGLGEARFATTFAQLQPGGDIGETLRRFGRSLLQNLTSDEALAIYRLFVVASVEGTLGARVFSEGPAKAEAVVTALVESAIAAGQLRRCDSRVASAHLRGLIEAEFLAKRLFRAVKPLTSRQIGAAVDRAVDAFLAAYGPEEPARRRR